MILNSHENSHGTGFPKGKNCPANIPLGSQLMQICELLDQNLLITPSYSRFEVSDRRQEVLNFPVMNNFNPDLIINLKKIWFA